MKICNHEDCKTSAHCKGFCQWHYWQDRNRINRTRKQVKVFERGTIGKTKANKPINFRSKKGQRVANADAKFFRQIWLEREPYSEVSGEWLGDTFNPVFFSHVISKGAFPKARYWKENIVLKTFKEHSFYENGDPKSEEYKTKFKEVLRLKEKLIVRYYEKN